MSPREYKSFTTPFAWLGSTISAEAQDGWQLDKWHPIKVRLDGAHEQPQAGELPTVIYREPSSTCYYGQTVPPLYVVERALVLMYRDKPSENFPP